MSREQTTESKSHHDASSVDATNSGDIQGLPPHLHTQVMQLRPGDVEGLCFLLKLHHEMTQQILAVASPRIGVSTVKQAISSLQRTNVVIDASAVPASMRPDAETAIEGGGASADVAAAAERERSFRPGGEQELESGPPSVINIALAEAARPPAWIDRARKYNAAHAHLVAEFNTLTNKSCYDDISDDDGVVDPKLVAEWQRKHGLEADGKVGPRTVAEARKHTDDGDVEKPAPAPAPAAPPV